MDYPRTPPVDPSYILDLSDKAARTVLRGRPCWTAQDWEDAKQEAARAILEMKGEHREGVLFLQAKHAIIDWLRVWLRHPRGGTILDYLDYAEDAERVRAISIEPLRLLLRTQGAAKADEDMRYLALRLQGYSTDGIALEMGLSRRNVYAIRERLLPRLERLARGETPISRADAIRAGWARRKTTYDRSRAA